MAAATAIAAAGNSNAQAPMAKATVNLRLEEYTLAYLTATNPLSCSEWIAARASQGRPKPSPFEADEWLRYQREVRNLERHVLSSVAGPSLYEVVPQSCEAAEHAPPRLADQRAVVTPCSRPSRRRQLCSLRRRQ